MVIGTPSYMSPEQCRGLEADARSDLFSTGVVLYELLTGEKPFRGNARGDRLQDLPRGAGAAVARCRRSSCPPAVDQLVATALAKEPAERFPSARAFHDALRDVAQMSVEVDNGLGTTMVNIGTLMLQKPAPAWDDETLRTAEHELARALGPMAKMIVRRAAAQTSDRAELCSMLSDNIIDPDTRRRFVDAFNADGQRRAQRRSGARARRRSAARRRRRASRRAPAARGERAAARARARTAGACTRAARTGVRRPGRRRGSPSTSVRSRRSSRGRPRANAQSRRDFVRRVADNLGTQERAAFLREIGFGD